MPTYIRFLVCLFLLLLIIILLVLSQRSMYFPLFFFPLLFIIDRTSFPFLSGFSLFFSPSVCFSLRAVMDPLSRDLEKAELETSRPSYSSHHHQQEAASAPRSASLSSSDSSLSQSQFRYDDNYISQIQTAQTQRSAVLERHATAVSRIATQRSQHSATVGALKSRSSRRPLPEFGAGKPYPPLLPSREEYVVEFSGPDDPMHPQNWSTIKK